MLNIIRTNGTQYELPRNTLEKIGEQKSCNGQQPVTAFYNRDLSVTSSPPLKRFKPDNPARDQYPAFGMSVIEVLESAKCVVCHDIYEQTILERNCEQALCLHCHEQIVKNECPACKQEMQLIRLSRDSARTVTSAIIKCNLRGGTKSAEAMESAGKHKEFYAGRYRLRDPATFTKDYDLAYLSNDSEVTLSDMDSNSVTDEGNSSSESHEPEIRPADRNSRLKSNSLVAKAAASDQKNNDLSPGFRLPGETSKGSSGKLPPVSDGESGHEEECTSETQSHSSLSPGEDNHFSDAYNEASEVESNDNSSGGEPDDCSLDGKPDNYSDGESDDNSSDGEPDDYSLAGDSNVYASDNESVDCSRDGEPVDCSDGESDDNSSDGEPDDYSLAGDSNVYASDNESVDCSEGESDDNSSDGEPGDYSLAGDSNVYSSDNESVDCSDGESDDNSSGGEPGDYSLAGDSNVYSSDNESVDRSDGESDDNSSGGEPGDYTLGGDSNDYSSDNESVDCSRDGESVDHCSNDESNNDSSDDEPDAPPSQSNAAETDGSTRPSIGEFLSGVLSSFSHFISNQSGNSN